MFSMPSFTDSSLVCVRDTHVIVPLATKSPVIATSPTNEVVVVGVGEPVDSSREKFFTMQFPVVWVEFQVPLAFKLLPRHHSIDFVDAVLFMNEWLHVVKVELVSPFDELNSAGLG